MSLRFKPEVRIVYHTEQLAHVFLVASLWSLRSRVDVQVNSVDDGAGAHLLNSLHGCSLAVDLDIVNDRQLDLEELAEYLRRTLDPQFDIVWEGDHVHVEWDAHRGPLMKRPP